MDRARRFHALDGHRINDLLDNLSAPVFPSQLHLALPTAVKLVAEGV